MAPVNRCLLDDIVIELAFVPSVVNVFVETSLSVPWRPTTVTAPNEGILSLVAMQLVLQLVIRPRCSPGSFYRGCCFIFWCSLATIFGAILGRLVLLMVVHPPPLPTAAWIKPISKRSAVSNEFEPISGLSMFVVKLCAAKDSRLFDTSQFEENS